MEKIKLLKEEIQVLRLLDAVFRGIPSDMPYEKYITALISLRSKGRAQYTPLTTRKPWNIDTTEKDRACLYENHSLWDLNCTPKVLCPTFGVQFSLCAIALFLATIAFVLAGLFLTIKKDAPFFKIACMLFRERAYPFFCLI